MKWFASSTLRWFEPVTVAIQSISQKGLAGVEIWSEHIDYYQTSIRDIQKVQESLSLMYTFHAPSWDLNLTALNKGMREQSIGEIERSFERAALLKAPNVTVHPGRLTVANSLLAWHEEQQIKSTERLVILAKQYGVTLSMEMMEPIRKELITTPEQMNRLTDVVGHGIEVTFDVAHLPLTTDVVQAFGQTKRIGKVHVSDSTPVQYHVPLGEGAIRLEPVMEKLKHVSVPLVLEGMDRGHDQTLERHLRYIENSREESVNEISCY
ncbi:sugar phosphate isomerase/epimerase [Jeotgalibacillus sp. R-1-5s-1]|uniref:sugar phosphate isomerase/epimerase family protein n=1 Tax=Jeotgalibacillus sp. R-1-5s-1 TaxID=2555897 RepID=UPI001069DDBB|nr:sugar phosphate isomerase/epimerase family protein [Jeotgalibacillus sp. R-1-5s-1]TFD96616.1 sugar phosphate isomerase/epimerase [Jeotgalibacillus sp. R-1-5s-1]